MQQTVDGLIISIVTNAKICAFVVVSAAIYLAYRKRLSDSLDPGSLSYGDKTNTTSFNKERKPGGGHYIIYHIALCVL
jgi:hypothetical protein